MDNIIVQKLENINDDLSKMKYNLSTINNIMINLSNFYEWFYTYKKKKRIISNLHFFCMSNNNKKKKKDINKILILYANHFNIPNDIIFIIEEYLVLSYSQNINICFETFDLFQIYREQIVGNKTFYDFLKISKFFK